MYMRAHRCAGGVKKKFDLHSNPNAIDISWCASTAVAVSGEVGPCKPGKPHQLGACSYSN